MILIFYGATPTCPDRRVTERPYDPTLYGNIERVLDNNIIYVANLHAMAAWYDHVRIPHAAGDRWRAAACRGARTRLGEMVRERVKQLGRLAENVGASVAAASRRSEGTPTKPFDLQRRFCERWPAVADGLELPERTPAPTGAAAGAAARFVDSNGADYLAIVAALSQDERHAVTAWLQTQVDTLVKEWSRELKLQSQE